MSRRQDCLHPVCQCLRLFVSELLMKEEGRNDETARASSRELQGTDFGSLMELPVPVAYQYLPSLFRPRR